MADTIIGATLQVDASSAVVASKSVADLKTQIKDLKTNFENAAHGSVEQESAFKQLSVAQDQLKTTTENLNKKVEESGGHFKNIKEQMTAIPGPLGAAGEGVNKLSGTFKALLANPVVLILAAIVGALALLYSAFTGTAGGAEKMEQIFSGLGAVVDVIKGRILKFATAITDFFNGDFSKAAQDAKEAFSGIGDEIVGEFNKAAEITHRIQELDRAFNQLSVSRAKLNRDLVGAKEIINDENASLADKRKAIDEVRVAEGKQSAEELNNAKLKLAAIHDQVEQKRHANQLSLEDIKKEQEAQKNFYAVQEQDEHDKININKQNKRLEKQEAAEEKAAAKEAADAAKQRRQELVDFTNKLSKLRQENELALTRDMYAKDKQALENKINDEKRAEELQLQDKKITRAQYHQLIAAIDIKAGLERDQLTAKHNDEIAKKEEAFQKELAGLKKQIALDAITDTRELERAKLQIDYEEKLKEEIVKYKDNSAQLNEVKKVLAEKYHADLQKQQEKFEKEDQKKKYEAEQQKLKATVSDKNSPLALRKAALDADEKLQDDYYNRGIIAEQEYNTKKAELAKAREQIDNEEAANKLKLLSAVSSGLTAVSDIVGKNTLVGKALAVASSSINTYSAIAGQLAAFSGVSIPGYAIAQAIATGLVGLKSVRDIIAVQVPGQGSGATGSAPNISASGAAAAPLRPKVQQSTLLNQNAINNTNNAAFHQQPLQAFVVESSGATARERSQRLSRAARLGG